MLPPILFAFGLIGVLTAGGLAEVTATCC